ncbi:Hypothetical predicted protein [Lecanosticta acicola]|uniref:Uncharacterized protein n=1 Tax=Lecanosticta acicola TaxID=111012 RepID=A0AAI8YVW6_9PEZI|nr:Hypothetical predicted protein [Lecanosticta acicola]
MAELGRFGTDKLIGIPVEADDKEAIVEIDAPEAAAGNVEGDTLDGGRADDGVFCTSDAVGTLGGTAELGRLSSDTLVDIIPVEIDDKEAIVEVDAPEAAPENAEGDTRDVGPMNVGPMDSEKEMSGTRDVTLTPEMTLDDEYRGIEGSLEDRVEVPRALAESDDFPVTMDRLVAAGEFSALVSYAVGASDPLPMLRLAFKEVDGIAISDLLVVDSSECAPWTLSLDTLTAAEPDCEDPGSLPPESKLVMVVSSADASPSVAGEERELPMVNV